MNFVLDTNIISYFLKDTYDLAEKIRAHAKAKNSIIISSITYYETRRGLYAVNSHRRLENFTRLCQGSIVKNMDIADWDRAAQLYADCKKAGHPMEDADLFQAAFCLRNGFTLVTHNIKHFEHITDLRVVDWC